MFLIEYLGPLLIHPLMFQLRPYIYSYSGSSSFPPPSALQSVSLLLICLHFLKREYETVFVHRFSAATMPVRNIFKNSFHYWVISGVFVAYFIYGPAAPTAGEIRPWITLPGLVLFIVGELGNLYSHLVLRSLRSSGGKERGDTQRIQLQLGDLSQLHVRNRDLGRDDLDYYELGDCYLCCRINRSNGTVGKEEGNELSKGVWRQVQEEEVLHAAWNLLGDLNRCFRCFRCFCCPNEIRSRASTVLMSAFVHAYRTKSRTLA